MSSIRAAAMWAVGLVAIAFGLALGMVALGLALVLLPVVFLVARWLLRRSSISVVRVVRRSGVHGQRPDGREVYEGEFRVLEERREKGS